jgi:hypothetical protein
MRPLQLILALLAVLAVAGSAAAQLAPAWMIPAAARTPGEYGTFWLTDLSVHNPHAEALPVAVQALPTGSENWSVPTVRFDVAAFATVNLWDALGPSGLALDGTAALLVWVDRDPADCPGAACDIYVSSRTYTPDPLSEDGEFGQTIPGERIDEGVSWDGFGYLAGVLNDDVSFRCNVGIASWTAEWTSVSVDVQADDGTILATEELVVPPFGHVQRRLATPVEGGSLVFYLVDGPDDALVYPYASLVNRATGDASFLSARWSVVGVGVASVSTARSAARARPRAAGPVRTLEPIKRGAARRR